MLIFWLGLFAAALLPPQTLQSSETPQQKNNTEGSPIFQKLIEELRSQPKVVSEVTYDENGRGHVQKISTPPSSGVFGSSTVTNEKIGENDHIGAIYLDENGKAHLRRFSSNPSYTKWFSSEKSEGSAGVAQKALIHRKVNIQSATLYRFKQKNTLQPVVQEILVEYPPVSQNFVYDLNNISCLFNSSNDDFVVLPPKPPQIVEVVPPKPPQVVEVVPSQPPQTFEIVPNDVRVVLPADTALLGSFPTISENLPKRVHQFSPNGVVGVPQAQPQHFVGDDCEVVEEIYVPNNPQNIDRVSVSTPDLLWPKWNNLPKRVRPGFNPQNNPSGGVPFEKPPQGFSPPPKKIDDNVQIKVQTPGSTQILGNIAFSPELSSSGNSPVNFDVQKLTVSSPELLWPKWNGLPKNLPKKPLASSGYIQTPPQNNGDVDIDVSSSSTSSVLTPASTKLLGNNIHYQQQQQTNAPQKDVSSHKQQQNFVPQHQNNIAQHPANLVMPASTQLLGSTPVYHQKLESTNQLGQKTQNSAQDTPSTVLLTPTNPHYLSLVDLQNLGVSWDNLPKRVNPNFNHKNVKVDGSSPAPTNKLEGFDRTYFGVLPKRFQPGLVDGSINGDFVSLGYAQTPASTELLGGAFVHHQKFDQNAKNGEVLPKNAQAPEILQNSHHQNVFVGHSNVLPKRVQPGFVGEVSDGSINGDFVSVGYAQTPASTKLLGGSLVHHQNFYENAKNSEALPGNVQAPSSTKLLQNNHNQNVFVESSDVVPKRVHSGFVFQTDDGLVNNNYLSSGYAQMPASTKLLGGVPVHHQNIGAASKYAQNQYEHSSENIQTPHQILQNVLPKRVQPGYVFQTVGGSANNDFVFSGYPQTPSSTKVLGNANILHQNVEVPQKSNQNVPSKTSNGVSYWGVLPKRVQQPGFVFETADGLTNNGFVSSGYAQMPASTKLLGDVNAHQQYFKVASKNAQNQHANFSENVQTPTSNEILLNVSSGYPQTPASTKLLGNTNVLHQNVEFVQENVHAQDNQNGPSPTSNGVSYWNVLPKRVNSEFVTQNFEGSSSKNNFFGQSQTPASTQLIGSNFDHQDRVASLNEVPSWSYLPKNYQTSDGIFNHVSSGYAQTPASTNFLGDAHHYHQNFEVVPQHHQNVQKAEFFGNSQMPASAQSYSSNFDLHSNSLPKRVLQNVNVVGDNTKTPASTSVLSNSVFQPDAIQTVPEPNLPKRVKPFYVHQGVLSKETPSPSQFFLPSHFEPMSVSSNLPNLPKRVQGVHTNFVNVDVNSKTPASTQMFNGALLDSTRTYQQPQNGEVQNVQNSVFGQTPASAQVLQNERVQNQNNNTHFDFSSSNVLGSFESNLPKRVNLAQMVPQQSVKLSQNLNHQNVENVGYFGGDFDVNVQNPASNQVLSSNFLEGGSRISQQHQNGEVQENVQNPVFGQIQTPASTQVLQNELVQNQNSDGHFDFSSSNIRGSFGNDLPKTVHLAQIVSQPSVESSQNLNHQNMQNVHRYFGGGFDVNVQNPASTQILRSNFWGSGSRIPQQHQNGEIQKNVQNSVFGQTPAATQVLQNERVQNQNRDGHFDFSSSNILGSFENSLPMRVNLDQVVPQKSVVLSQNLNHQNVQNIDGHFDSGFDVNVQNPASTQLLSGTFLGSDSRISQQHQNGVVENVQNSVFGQTQTPASTQVLQNEISPQKSVGVEISSPTPMVSSENHQNGVYVDFSSSGLLVPFKNDLPKHVNFDFRAENPHLVLNSTVQTPPSTQLFQNIPNFENRISENDQNETNSTSSAPGGGTNSISSMKLYESQRVEAPPNISGNPQNTLFESALLPKNTQQNIQRQENQEKENVMVEPPKSNVVVENFAQIGVLKPTQENLPKRVQDLFDVTNNEGAEISVPKLHDNKNNSFEDQQVSSEETTSEVPTTVEPSPAQTETSVAPEIEEAFANFGKRISHANKDSGEPELGDLVPNSHGTKKVVVYKKNPEVSESGHRVKVVKMRPLPKNYQKQMVGNFDDTKLSGGAPSGTYRLVGGEIAIPNEEVPTIPINNQQILEEPHKNGAIVSPPGTSPFTGVLSGSFGRIPALRLSPFVDGVGSSENTPKNARFVPEPHDSVQNDRKSDGDIKENGKTS